jgi:hypothetical protein
MLSCRVYLIISYHATWYQLLCHQISATMPSSTKIGNNPRPFSSRQKFPSSLPGRHVWTFLGFTGVAPKVEPRWRAYMPRGAQIRRSCTMEMQGHPAISCFVDAHAREQMPEEIRHNIGVYIEDPDAYIRNLICIQCWSNRRLMISRVPRSSCSGI